MWSCISKIKTVAGTYVEDWSGKTINKITFLSLTDKKCSMGWIWECKCFCGKIFEANVSDVKRGHTTSCGCARKKPRPYRIKNLVGQKFGKLTVIELLNDTHPTRYRCKCDCGRYTEVRGGNLVSGQVISCGCATYFHPPKANLVGKTFGDLTVIECCKERKNKNIVWKCKCSCGNIHYVTTRDLNRDSTTSCGHKQLDGIKPFWFQEEDLTGQRFGKLTVLNKTKRDKKGNILRLCQCDCGEKIYCFASNLKRGFTQSCGKCIKSKGEDLIKSLLNQMNIDFIQEKTFDKCINPKTNYKLRFDFYLPDYNCCIEYDGAQHFQETSMCGDSLEDRQYRDNIKNKFCTNNDIGLVRIPYIDLDKIDTNYLREALNNVKQTRD